ncbi:methyltransferase family protein [Aureimonas pseudogalii]|uniref:Protein-S-isoprenylcysteine O-methyltransferase Ste14 n=1 Tax=Aureimonas pseudogalii TaxID=1744844 RepID=A0A7W6H8X7_9HYPH|nr:isoprenylcysteine carboxylmethyltransferase family protein [Aureimonas pseudogalii]MBB4000773.1 protein-S-isoprenylcysteine O-methyltransferase Ste14 [Aureimonas pseudogalii]
MTHMGTNLHGLDELQLRRKTTIRIAVLLFAPLVIFGTDAAPEGSAYRMGVETFGFLLVFAGILGRAWSTLYIGGRKARQLVMVGPYSVSRNPLYVFVAVAGLGAQTGSLVVACLFVAGAYLIFAPVVRHEEGALDAIFGSEFDAYRARAPRFLPRLSQWRDVAHLEIDPKRYRQTVLDGSIMLGLALAIDAANGLRALSPALPLLPLP